MGVIITYGNFISEIFWNARKCGASLIVLLQHLLIPKKQSNERQCYTYQLGFDFCWSTFFPFLYILAQQAIKCGHTYVKVIIKRMMQGDFNLNSKTKNINKATNPSTAIIPDLWHLGLDIDPWHILLIRTLLSLPSKVFMLQHSDINFLWNFGKNKNLFKQV